jgi:iron complex outermembrane recepter protein
MTRGFFRGAVLTALLGCTCLASAWAQAPLSNSTTTTSITIPSQDLSGALLTLGRQTGRSVTFLADVVAGKRSSSVQNAPSFEAALQQMLIGTNLQFVISPDGSASVAQRTSAAPAAPASAREARRAEEAPEEVLVTGSRIRGAPVASQVISLGQVDFQNAGHHDLGEVIRAIPQNFAGGTNPSAGSRGSVTSDSNVGSGGASTLNLRGIGNDATLTLLNGHRLATTGNSGIDINAIPIAAIERVEILTDGASALYGSDAVGGVANIIMKKSYEGFSATALYGGSTDGGFKQQQFSAVGGTVWDGGGLIGTAMSNSNSAITARQRSYTASANPENTLYPDLSRRNLSLSARQDLDDRTHVALDALYSHTNIGSVFGFTRGPVTASGSTSKGKVNAFLVAPSMQVDLRGDWVISGYATYAKDELDSVTTGYSAGAVSSLTEIQLFNRSSSVEASAEGPLLSLPAGDLRLAFGGGYRENQGQYRPYLNGALRSSNYTGTDSISYGFGELAVPLVAPAQNIPFVESLNASAALRYEKYRALGSVATPKFGLIYGVTPSITLKASWGKSFKVTPFGQRLQEASIALANATGYGALYPSDATYLYLSGGNTKLQPERATSTTLTAEFHPRSLPALRVGASYYHIDFKDRVVVPFTSNTGVLTNPIYANFVTLNPSAAVQAAAIASVPSALLFSTGVTQYAPAKVVGLIDRRYVNANKQVIDGFDVSASYRFDLAAGDSLTLSTSSTYLHIDQQLLSTIPMLELTGNFYQPRRFKSRNGASWETGELIFSGFANYISGAKFRAVTPVVDIKPLTSVDLTARWAPVRSFSPVFALNIINAFDAKPTVVRSVQTYETSYDATAYAATGRTISLSMSVNF